MKNKVCLVTGASRGIGRSIVKKMLEADATVIATARSIINLKDLQKEFAEYASNLRVFEADLSLPLEVQKFCETITKKVGNIDVLINNAGVLYLEPLNDSSEELLRKSFEVNLFAPFALTRHFSRSMVTNRAGTIINLCSSSSYTGGGAPGHCIYASTKHALLGFSRALDDELRSYNIRIGTVSPAGVSTSMMANRGDLDHSSFMSADEVADAVMYMIKSEGAGIIYEMRMWRKDR